MSEEKVNDNIDGDPMSPYYTNKLNPIDDGEFDNIIKLQKEQGDMFPFGEILNLTPKIFKIIIKLYHENIVRLMSEINTSFKGAFMLGILETTDGLRSRFCKECKSDGMIEPNRKLCKCGVRPTFNIIGLKAEYCNSCKSDEMVNVSDKRCFCGKLTSPCFNYFGLVGKYCFDCKLPDMVDVRNLRCECGKSKAGFNFDGLNARFCSICKLEGMIDVIHKKCNCGKNQPNFNFEGLQSEYCSVCKLDGMINVHHKLCFCGNAHPIYNYEGLIAQYCSKCKTDDIIDVKHLKCKTNLCNTRVEEKYEGYCFRCFIYTFPDKPMSKNYKTKCY